MDGEVGGAASHAYPQLAQRDGAGELEGHHDDSTEVVPRLHELPSTEFVVDDPHKVCTVGMGFGVDFVDVNENWELSSTVSRAVVAHRVAV